MTGQADDPDDDGPPAEVVAAAKRLAEDEGSIQDIPLIPTLGERAAAHRPQVFREIVKNDSERATIARRGSDMTQDDWRRLGALTRDRKQNLVPSAEKMLRWNTDKGERP